MVRLWANHASKFRSPLHPSRRIQTIRKKSKKADAAAAAKKRDKAKAEGRIALPLLFSPFFQDAARISNYKICACAKNREVKVESAEG